MMMSKLQNTQTRKNVKLPKTHEDEKNAKMMIMMMMRKNPMMGASPICKTYRTLTR
jgi:hypothetical protein